MTIASIGRAISLSRVTFPQAIKHQPTGLKGKGTIHRTRRRLEENPKTRSQLPTTSEASENGKGQRLRQGIRDAEVVATKLGNGESSALELTGDDRQFCGVQDV